MQESVFRAAVVDPPCQSCGGTPSKGGKCAVCARSHARVQRRREVLFAAFVTLVVQGVLFAALIKAGIVMVDLAFKGAGVAPFAVVFALWRFRPSVALGIACGAIGAIVGSYGLAILWFLWQLVTGQVC
jgi:hypothetical protein